MPSSCAALTMRPFKETSPTAVFPHLGNSSARKKGFDAVDLGVSLFGNWILDIDSLPAASRPPYHPRPHTLVAPCQPANRTSIGDKAQEWHGLSSIEGLLQRMLSIGNEKRWGRLFGSHSDCVMENKMAFSFYFCYTYTCVPPH